MLGIEATFHEIALVIRQRHFPQVPQWEERSGLAQNAKPAVHSFHRLKDWS